MHEASGRKAVNLDSERPRDQESSAKAVGIVDIVPYGVDEIALTNCLLSVLLKIF